MTTTIAAEAERERDHALPGKEHVTMCITWNARDADAARAPRRAISVRIARGR